MKIKKKLRNRAKLFLLPISYLLNYPISPPNNFHFLITKKCNLKCLNCDIWKNKNYYELTLSEWKKIIDSIYSWTGSFNANISGGEPLIRKDMLKIISYLKSHNCYVKINTNGVLLDKKISKKLLKENLDEISISLYSLNKRTYEKIRGVNSLDIVLKNISDLIKIKKEGKLETKIKLATLITKKNIKDIIEIINYSAELGIDISIQPLREPFNRKHEKNWYEKNSLWVHNNDEVEKLISKIILLKKKYRNITNSYAHLEKIKLYMLNQELFMKKEKKCFMPYENFVINEKGFVNVCYDENHIGKMPENSARKIWFSQKNIKNLKKLKNCRKNCRVIDWYSLKYKIS